MFRNLIAISLIALTAPTYAEEFRGSESGWHYGTSGSPMSEDYHRWLAGYVDSYFFGLTCKNERFFVFASHPRANEHTPLRDELDLSFALSPEFLKTYQVTLLRHDATSAWYFHELVAEEYKAILEEIINSQHAAYFRLTENGTVFLVDGEDKISTANKFRGVCNPDE